MFKYRLDPLLAQRMERKELAEQGVAERLRELDAEKQKLDDAQHRQAELMTKRERVRSELLVNAGEERLTGNEVSQRRNFLRGVEQDVETARDEVFAQKQAVDESATRLSDAQEHLTVCAREVEVLEKHREKQKDRFDQQAERQEAKELDEIGASLFISKRRIT